MSAKLLVFAVYDSKAEVYMTPMFFPAKGLAIRTFDDQVNNPDSLLNKHPEDFTLFCIGDYDQDTGLLTPLPTPASLGLAVEFKRSDET